MAAVQISFQDALDGIQQELDVVTHQKAELRGMLLSVTRRAERLEAALDENGIPDPDDQAADENAPAEPAKVPQDHKPKGK